jgi:hypothetical protein
MEYQVRVEQVAAELTDVVLFWLLQDKARVSP